MPHYFLPRTPRRPTKRIPYSYYWRIKQIPWRDVLKAMGIEKRPNGGGIITMHCVFHNERSPSLRLVTRGRLKGKFKCFGCGNSGDAFHLVHQWLQSGKRRTAQTWQQWLPTTHGSFVGPVQTAKFFKRHFGIPIPRGLNRARDKRRG